jgi:hypothetical protein
VSDNGVTLFGIPNAKSATECTITRSRSYIDVSRLVYAWHSTLPHSPAGFRVAFVVYAPNYAPVAAAMWGRPTARMEDQTNTLELTRLAHSPYAPYNLGSWALARMREWIRHNMPEIERLITYHDATVHHGTIYAADNWRQVYDKRGESTWSNRPGRLRTERLHKGKWEREP